MTNSVGPSATGVRPARERLGRVDSVYAAVAGLLTLYACLHLKAALAHVSPDIDVFYLRWYEHILTFGRLRSLEGSYANYAPPYLYLLSLASLLDGRIAPVTLIKLVQLPAMFASAWLFWSLCRKLGCTQTRSLLAAWMVLVAPEVFQDTLLWGQCDMLHTACLLGMLRLQLARRPGWAMGMLGVAIAFKLQAVFAGAAVAALFLSGEAPLWSAFCVPVGYGLMMFPAWLAGRPGKQLIFLYTRQVQFEPDIANNVANPYELIYHFSARHPDFYSYAMRAGFLLAGSATIWLMIFLGRSPWRLRGQRLIYSMAAALLLEPYVLPKMHDRYFFSGDVLAVLIAMMRPELWAPVAMMQASALYVAYPHLYLEGFREPTVFFVVPVLMMTVALVWMGKVLFVNDTKPSGQGTVVH